MTIGLPSSVIANRTSDATNFASRQGARASRVASLPIFNPKVGATLLPNIKSWWIRNIDTGEVLSGPYETEATKTSGSQYANTWALNRKDPIKSFLHGKIQTVTFSARLYATHIFQEVQSTAEKLEAWSQRDESLGRPPILYFWIGDQHVSMASCTLNDVSIKFDRPGFLGKMRGADISVTLEKYVPFQPDITKAAPNTRYHKVKLGDNYEMIARREYGNAMKSVVIRQLNPDKLVLKPGDIIKLPSNVGNFRRLKAEPQSIALKTSLNRRDTSQKLNLQASIKRHKINQPRYVIR